MGENTFAEFILESNDFTDGLIPKSLSADLLTSPPQCSGLPTSNPSSKTNTEFPPLAISRAANNPEILPPATIASYIRVHEKSNYLIQFIILFLL